MFALPGWMERSLRSVTRLVCTCVRACVFVGERKKGLSMVEQVYNSYNAKMEGIKVSTCFCGQLDAPHCCPLISRDEVSWVIDWPWSYRIPSRPEQTQPHMISTGFKLKRK